MSSRATFVFRTLASLALAALAAPAPAAAPANSFNIVSSAGKNVGSAAYTLTKDKNGYHLVGKFQYHLGSSVQADTATGAADGRMGSMVAYNEGQFSEDFKVSEDGSFLSGYTQNSSTQLMTSYAPNKAGTLVTINNLQAGVSAAHDVTIPKPSFLVVPDFDPAALQLFLTTALAHPHDDKTYLFVIPVGSIPRGQEKPAYVILQLAPGTPSGTLDGKPIQLMHYFLGYHTGKPSDLYTDSDGNLMQADITPLGVSFIRAKFSMSK